VRGKNIIAELHRSMPAEYVGPRIRRYSSLDSALANAQRWLKNKGVITDMVVISHQLTGVELAVVKYRIRGTIETTWTI